MLYTMRQNDSSESGSKKITCWTFDCKHILLVLLIIWPASKNLKRICQPHDSESHVIETFEASKLNHSIDNQNLVGFYTPTASPFCRGVEKRA